MRLDISFFKAQNLWDVNFVSAFEPEIHIFSISVGKVRRKVDCKTIRFVESNNNKYIGNKIVSGLKQNQSDRRVQEHFVALIDYKNVYEFFIFVLVCLLAFGWYFGFFVLFIGN